MRDYLQGRRCMVWSFMQNARMYEALRDYGDRLDTVGIFTFEVDATGTLSETGTSISSMMAYINKWPHIHWMLTVMNHGTASIFTALRNNTNGAKDKFLTELVRIMENTRGAPEWTLIWSAAAGMKTGRPQTACSGIYTRRSKPTIPPSSSISACPA